MKTRLFLFIFTLIICNFAFADTFGKVNIISPNDSCAIFIDGDMVAYGSSLKYLPEGRHRISIVEPSGKVLFNDYIYVKGESDNNIDLSNKSSKAVIPVPVPATKEAAVPKKKIELSSGFEVAYLISQFHYQEPKVMEESGPLYGFNTSYTFRSPIRLMIKGEARYLAGLVSYDGETWAGTPLRIKDIPDYMWEARGMIGYDFDIAENTALTPYVGYGYRYLNDNANIQYAGGYMREANYFYNPIGIELMINDEGNKYGLKFEQDQWIWGKQFSHLSDVDGKSDDAMNPQKKGSGFRASILAEFNISGVILKFEGYQINWVVPQSDVVDVYIDGLGTIGVVEPENHSSETGISFGIMY